MEMETFSQQEMLNMIGDKRKEISEGSNNIQADGNVNVTTQNYYQSVNADATSQTIIDEMFLFAIHKAKSSQPIEKAKPEKHLKTIKKIRLNFKKTSIIKEVEQHFIYAYQKISIIENRFAELDPSDQNDVHSYIYGLYTENKSAGMSNIDNLNKLFRTMIPDGKDKDPQFSTCAKALVLFFFDDCTIFEKTRLERQTPRELL